MEKINWTVNVQVEGGPAVDASDAITVDAYDKLAVEVAAGAQASLELQPGGAGQVKFLLINSDTFDPALTYSVDGGATTIQLDALHLLIGDGAVGLLGPPPQTLDVDNATQDPAKIAVTVGRKAT